MKRTHDIDCGYAVTGHIHNCSCGAVDDETPSQQTPTPLTDEFVDKVVSEKGQMGFSVKEIIKLGDFARQLERELDETKSNHCKDCCCAESWKALGIAEYTGKSIPEHIQQLQKQNQELRSVAEMVVTKVESGKMSSKKTYALAKKVLQLTLPYSPLFTKEDVMPLVEALELIQVMHIRTYGKIEEGQCIVCDELGKALSHAKQKGLT